MHSQNVHDADRRYIKAAIKLHLTTGECGCYSKKNYYHKIKSESLAYHSKKLASYIAGNQNSVDEM